MIMVHHPTIQLSKEVHFRGKQPAGAAAAAAAATAATAAAAALNQALVGSSVRTLQYQGSRVRLYHASNKGRTNPRLGNFSFGLF